MNQVSKPSSTRRGAIGKSCLIGLAVVAVIVGLCVMMGVGGYNSLVKGQEGVKQKWANVENF